MAETPSFMVASRFHGAHGCVDVSTPTQLGQFDSALNLRSRHFQVEFAISDTLNKLNLQSQ